MFQTQFTCIRHAWKLHKLKETLPFSALPSFDDSDGQFAVQRRLSLDCINHHTSLKRTKFTGPSVPWMRELDHNLITEKIHSMKTALHVKKTEPIFGTLETSQKRKQKILKHNFEKKCHTKKCKRNFENS